MKYRCKKCKLEGNVGVCDDKVCVGFNLGSTTTQNDWEKRYTDMLREFKRQTKEDMVADVLVMKSYIAKELADAREEVIREVETQRDLLEATMKDSERKSGYYLSGLVRLSMAILASLRKESK